MESSIVLGIGLFTKMPSDKSSEDDVFVEQPVQSIKTEKVESINQSYVDFHTSEYYTELKIEKDEPEGSDDDVFVETPLPTIKTEEYIDYKDFDSYEATRFKNEPELHNTNELILDKPKTPRKNWILKKHQRNGLYYCPFCSTKGVRESRPMESHILNTHCDVENAFSYISRHIYRCTLCTYRSVYRKNFTRHLSLHDSGKLKRSSISDKRFLDREIKMALNVGNMHCYHCDYKTKDKCALVRHVRIHRPKDQMPFTCQGCDKKFNEKNGLDSHIVKSHRHNIELINLVTNKIYECDECNYANVRKSKVLRHAKTHRK